MRKIIRKRNKIMDIAFEAEGAFRPLQVKRLNKLKWVSQYYKEHQAILTPAIMIDRIYESILGP